MMSKPLTYFEDVAVGDEVGPMEMVAADADVVAFCEVWGNETPNRFTDRVAAETVRLPGPIVPGIMSMAMMAQLLTHWAGPKALRDLDLVFRQSVPHNRPLKISAIITDTRQEKGENLVECDILMSSPEGGLYVAGKAILALPSKDG
jgi:acyl dehydratase